MERKITWRIGGLRSASSSFLWKPEEGMTGFVNGRRWIEEPNPLSVLSRNLFARGYSASVSIYPVGPHKSCCFDHSDHLSLMECVHIHSQWDDNILVTWFKEDSPDNWIIIEPKTRMTAREIMVLDFYTPSVKELFHADD